MKLFIRIIFGLLLGIAMAGYYFTLFFIMTIGVVPFCMIYAVYHYAKGDWTIDAVLKPAKIAQEFLWYSKN